MGCISDRPGTTGPSLPTRPILADALLDYAERPRRWLGVPLDTDRRLRWGMTPRSPATMRGAYLIPYLSSLNLAGGWLNSTDSQR